MFERPLSTLSSPVMTSNPNPSTVFTSVARLSATDVSHPRPSQGYHNTQ